jgi:heat-inducible transcriptional repressor
MAVLSERQRAILSLIVRDFIETAQPVGSQSVVQRHGLALSSATIRNEMAALEEMGFLNHPHTSAGRVPTVAGYRYFVEQLMGEIELPLAEQRMIQHQFHQAGMDLEAWMRLAASVVARAANAAGLVTAPRSFECRFKHLELIAIRDALVLLVVVLQDGAVLQQMLTSTESVAQEDLGRLSDQINNMLCGMSRREIEVHQPGGSPDRYRDLSRRAGQHLERARVC